MWRITANYRLIPSFLSLLELSRRGEDEQNKLRTMKISSTRSSFSDGTISIHGITRISFESFQVADKGRGLSSRHVQFTADTSIYLDEHVMAELYFRTSWIFIDVWQPYNVMILLCLSLSLYLHPSVSVYKIQTITQTNIGTFYRERIVISIRIG